MTGAARRAGLPSSARTEFARANSSGGKLSWATGDPTPANGSAIKPGDLAKVPGKQATYTLSSSQVADLKQRQSGYVAAGGRLYSGREVAAPSAKEATAAKAGIDRSATQRTQLEAKLPPPPAPKQQQPAKSKEGIGAFLKGAIKGDFDDNDSWSATAGQIVGGLNPLADARDTIAAIKNVAEGKEGAGIGLAAAVVGWVPVAGDGAKAALKAGRKILKESAGEASARAVKESAGTLGKIADPQARAAAEQAVRTEAATKHAVREVEVGKRMDDLAAQGHGPQRHGSHVTERQLHDRAVHGKDPVTGTTNDAYKVYANGTPKPHTPTKNATKVATDEAYVEAETHIRKSQRYKDEVAAAEAKGVNEVIIDDTRLKDIFGTDYKQNVFGKTRVSKNPLQSVDTDLTDGTMKVVYIKDANGKWNLTTMYPQPKKLFEKSYWLEPAKHQARHRDVDHRFAGASQHLIVFAQAAIEVQPREGALDNPAARQHGKADLFFAA